MASSSTAKPGWLVLQPAGEQHASPAHQGSNSVMTPESQPLYNPASSCAAGWWSSSRRTRPTRPAEHLAGCDLVVAGVALVGSWPLRSASRWHARHSAFATPSTCHTMPAGPSGIGQQLLDVAIGQVEAQAPADRNDYDIGRKAEADENGARRDRPAGTMSGSDGRCRRPDHLTVKARSGGGGAYLPPPWSQANGPRGGPTEAVRACAVNLDGACLG